MASIITPSTTYDDNYSNKTYASELIGESITDGVATFSGGTVINLVTPTDPQDAVTKGIVDGLVNVAPPVNSVQFNNTVFAGSSNLTFIPNTLTVNGTIDDGSGISIVGGTISGLNNPVSGTQIATKNYVDSFNSLSTNTYLQADVPATYTAAEMINGIIFRNLATYTTFNVNLTDTTASAAQLVAQVPTAQVGYAARFKVINDNPDANGTTVEGRDSFVLTINPGAGVTFYPTGSFNLRRGYALDAYIRFTNVITPAVTIIINRCTYNGLTLYLMPDPASSTIVFSNVIDYLNYTSMRLTGNMLWNTTDNVVTTQNYSYTLTDLKNQLVIRNPSAIASDTLGSNLSPRYLNQIMTIQNISANSVSISGQTNIWTLTPSTIVIPAGNQAVIGLNYSNPTISNAGSYYNYGTYNTTGGTGSGLIIVVTGLKTTSTLTVPGSGYSTGILTTTNLTTPSATGLVIDCNSVDGMTGAITGYQDIVNYVSGGYQDGDILQLNGGDGTARIQLTLVNSISEFYVSTLGNGNYLSTDVLTVSGPGTGSGAQLTLGSFLSVLTIGNYQI